MNLKPFLVIVVSALLATANEADSKSMSTSSIDYSHGQLRFANYYQQQLNSKLVKVKAINNAIAMLYISGVAHQGCFSLVLTKEWHKKGNKTSLLRIGVSSEFLPSTFEVYVSYLVFKPLFNVEFI